MALVFLLGLFIATPDPAHHSLAWELAHGNVTTDDERYRPIGDPQKAKHHIEDVIKANLRDPDSAKFEWPYRFVRGRYDSRSRGGFEGTITCGTVNSKNGFGGYTGREAVAAVLWGDHVVDIDLDEPTDDDQAGWVAAECGKLGMPVP